MGNVHFVVPGFGSVIKRERLVALFCAHGPALTIACAPSGYGKSVLAAQFAESVAFDLSLWVDMHEQDVTRASAASAIAAALSSLEGERSSGRDSALVETGAARAETLLILGQALARLQGRAVCLVLDNGATLCDLNDVQQLADALTTHTSSASRLIVTCRHANAETIDSARLWTITHADLRFKRHEIDALLEVRGDADDIDSGWILDRSGGQPALACLMVRHPAAVVDGAEAQDLLWYTDHLLSLVSDEVFEGLYCGMLLGEGTVIDLARCLGLPPGSMDLRNMSSWMPLFSTSVSGPLAPTRFRVHAALAHALHAQSCLRISDERRTELRSSALAFLHQGRAHERLLHALLTDGSWQECLAWCEVAGEAMLRAVGPSAMQVCLEQIPLTSLAASPRALLLNASVLRQLERIDDALRSATSAQRLAAHAGDTDTDAAASILVARLAVDTGDMSRVREVLLHLDRDASPAIAPSHECLVQAYLAICDALRGQIESAAGRTLRVRELLVRMDVGSDEAVFAVNSIGCVDGACRGSWPEVVSAIGAVAARSDLSPVQRLLVRANHAASLLEVGCLDDALPLSESAAREAECAGLRQLAAYALCTQSSALYAKGDPEAARAIFNVTAEALAAFDDTAGLSVALTQTAIGERACSNRHRSLALAERAVSVCERDREALALILASAQIEVAASLASIGDDRGSSALLSRVISGDFSQQAHAHRLRADLLLAELDMRREAHVAAVERISSHAAYFCDGSLNFQTALYVRAFPGILGVLAAAVGVDALPARFLNLISIETLEGATSDARGRFAPGLLIDLEERIRGFVDNSSSPSSGVSARAVTSTSSAEPSCYVQLLGGLRVSTSAGTVDECAWRKRKSRSLLVMLALQRGRDIPRDVILERLWPEMDYDHARNNFYVMWSTLKRILATGQTPESADRYIQHSGGLCRLTPMVRTDLDDFYDSIDCLRAALAADNREAVIRVARDLTDLYRGEVLPGDAYDDWVENVRVQVRHEFCDAVLSAARFGESVGDYDSAIEFGRKAWTVDPWREDIYQVMMRCHMSAGQRSRAIEAYLSCRSRLVEDLGIDPSAETTRIYQDVLAMEEASSPTRIWAVGD